MDRHLVGLNLFDDPLGVDEAGDVFIPATRRGLTRLAMVAAETGARFQREGGGACDPMAWLLAPRRLFYGSSAIEACMQSQNFSRALLLHGLSLGLDADPAEIDELLEDDDIDTDGADVDDNAAGTRLLITAPQAVARAEGQCVGVEQGSRRRLFTATIVFEDGTITLHAFHASIADDRGEIIDRLVARYGADAVQMAQIRAGFDPTSAFVEAMVSPATSDLLQLVDLAPASPIAAGLDLNLEQRFAI